MDRTAAKSTALLFATLLSLACGCQQSRQVFRPSTLPPQFSAPAAVNPAAIDLSQLAAASAATQTIYPGDVLEISVTTGAETRPVTPVAARVSQAGYVDVPPIGLVAVGGMDVKAAEQAIRQAAIQRDFFRRPNVTVLFRERMTHRVQVVGAVEAPGQYDIPAGHADLLSALVAAGGLKPEADTRVEVRFPGRVAPPTLAASEARRVDDPEPGAVETAGFDQAEATAGDVQPASYVGGSPPPAAEAASGATQYEVDLEQAQGGPRHRLPDGAIVTVRRRPLRAIQVIGLVNRPNQFEIPNDREVRLLDALAMAGGRTYEVADHVRLIRSVPGHADAVVVDVSVEDAKLNQEANLRLAPGDVVSVEQTPLTTTLSVIREMFGVGIGLRPF